MSENSEKKEIQIEKSNLVKYFLLIIKSILLSFTILFIISLFGETTTEYREGYYYGDNFYLVDYSGILGNVYFTNTLIPYNGNANFFNKIYIAYIPLIFKEKYIILFSLSLVIYLIMNRMKNYKITFK